MQGIQFYVWYWTCHPRYDSYPARLLNKAPRQQRAGTPVGGGCSNVSGLAVNQPSFQQGNSRSSSKLDDGTGGSVSSKNSSGSHLQKKYASGQRNNSDGNLSSSSSLRDVLLGDKNNQIPQPGFQHSHSVDRATTHCMQNQPSKVPISIFNLFGLGVTNLLPWSHSIALEGFMLFFHSTG